MRKTLSMLMGAAAALILGMFSASAEDVSLDTKKAVKASNDVSFTVNSNALSVSRFTSDTKITVSCTADDGEGSPVKLVLDYWDNSSEANGKKGEPAKVEVAAKEYSDGKAVFTYEDITAALGETDPVLVYAIDVSAVEGRTATCTGFDAAGVLSVKEAAEQGILHTTWVHAKNPKESEKWSQSIIVGVDQFDVSTMTDKSALIAFYDSDVDENIDTSPVEFILQSTDDKVSPKAKNGTVWAKVAPVVFNNRFAYFEYADMVDAYGTDDFKCVSTVYIGDTAKGKITCTDLFIFNCKTLMPEEPEPESSSEAETTTTTTTTAAAESQPEETVTSAAAATENESSGDKTESVGNSIVFVIIGIVAGVVIAVVVVFIILSRKSGKTYDVNRHRFVKKK
ncbi:MAG: hypothetical protein IKO27_03825 [Ruminococcus sp.]|nr:hypothetical protein [Ruminococcus sp.]